jgi:hypothetical protein
MGFLLFNYKYLIFAGTVVLEGGSQLTRQFVHDTNQAEL